jgi:hypothetical protein
MRLLSNSLQGYTNTQSSTIGWKEICCSKSSTAIQQQINTIRLNIASGNPEFYFTTFTDGSISNGNIGVYGAASGAIGHIRGFKVTTGGVISIPGGAVDIVFYASNNNLVDFPWPGYTTDTGNIYFRTGNSDNYSIVNTQIYLSVYSERIDLITLSCV